ncbi:helix-turn-helix domain-containing protein, partial [Acinetobacter sp. WCHAc060025]
LAVRYKAKGMSYAEIADKLKVSRRSVIYWCK